MQPGDEPVGPGVVAHMVRRLQPFGASALVLLQEHGAEFEQVVVLRRYVAHVILALALVPELGVIAPAAVLAVRDRLRPLEVRPGDWWG